MLKLFWHYVRAHAGRAFYKGGPDLEKAFDTVLVFIRGKTNRIELVERIYFEHLF